MLATANIIQAVANIKNAEKERLKPHLKVMRTTGAAKEKIIRDVVLFNLLEARGNFKSLVQCLAVCKSFRTAVSGSWHLLGALDADPRMALPDVVAALGRMGVGLKRLNLEPAFRTLRLSTGGTGPWNWTKELSSSCTDLVTRGVTLEELNISSMPQENSWLGLQSLFKSLTGIARQLSQLHIKGCGICIEVHQGLLLAELVKASPRLRVLKLHDLSPNRLLKLNVLESLTALTNLEELSFCRNFLQDDELHAMTALELSSVHTLKLAGPNVFYRNIDPTEFLPFPHESNGINANRGQAGLTALCKRLGECGALRHLDMTALFSYDSQFQGCFAGLHMLSRLETLNFSWNALFDEVPLSEFPSLSKSFSSTAERASRPTYSPPLDLPLCWKLQGCKDFCKCLSTSRDAGLLPSLKHLSLRACRIGSVGFCSHLLPVVSQLGSLRTLDLGGNHFGDAGAIALSHVLHTLTALTKVTCFNSHEVRAD